MIRFAIIGTNWITDRFLESAADIEDFQLTAVYSRSAERAGEFAAKHNAAHASAADSRKRSVIQLVPIIAKRITRIAPFA